MRKKIREMMNKEEGFTLVELLAVIVILGIIVAIAIPAVGSVVDRAQVDAEDAENALVEDAARLYVTTEEIPEADWGNGPLTIKVDDLISNGYLEERDAEDGEGNKLTGAVTVTREKVDDDENVYTYSYKYER